MLSLPAECPEEEKKIIKKYMNIDYMATIAPPWVANFIIVEEASLLIITLRLV